MDTEWIFDDDLKDTSNAGNSPEGSGRSASSWHVSYCFFHGLLGKLQKDKTYSDFTIRCGDREWNVHRAIVCPQSEIFEVACNGKFKEASSGVMTLTDDDPEIIEHLVHYFYNHTFEDKELPQTVPLLQRPRGQSETRVPGPHKTDNPARLPDCLKVYAVADKYMVPSLKVKAQTRFEHWCATNCATQSFLLAVREIYERKTGNYEDLHEAVLIPMAKRIDDLVGKKDFIELMEDCGELGLELLKKVNDWNRIARQGLDVDIAFLRSHGQMLQEKNRQLTDENRRLSRSLLALRTGDSNTRNRSSTITNFPSNFPSNQPQPVQRPREN